MRWQGRRGSGNVVDRRGMGGRGMKIGGVGGGVGIVILLIVMLLGGGPGALLDQGGSSSSLTQAQQDRAAQFASVVLADTEDVWHQQFREMGRTYREPTMVLFTDYVDSACGSASSAVGPFYCPGDQSVYLDLSFFDELSRRFGAPGDFAQAYVIAHEVGHHVQNLLGISDAVSSRQQRVSQEEANQLVGAARAAGRLPRRRVGALRPERRCASWRPGTSRRPSGRPRPSATTPCSARPRATWCPTRSPTAPPRSAPAGSSWASRRATSPRATRSTSPGTSSNESLGRLGRQASASMCV